MCNRATQVDIQGIGKRFPRASILLKLFDGKGSRIEAQECRVMAENEISHVRNIPGSPDQPGISTDHLGDLQPKADGPWEPIPDDPCQRVLLITQKPCPPMGAIVDKF